MPREPGSWQRSSPVAEIAFAKTAFALQDVVIPRRRYGISDRSSAPGICPCRISRPVDDKSGPLLDRTQPSSLRGRSAFPSAQSSCGSARTATGRGLLREAERVARVTRKSFGKVEAMPYARLMAGLPVDRSGLSVTHWRRCAAPKLRAPLFAIRSREPRPQMSRTPRFEDLRRSRPLSTL